MQIDRSVTVEEESRSVERSIEFPPARRANARRHSIRVLLLGGTAEGRILATKLSGKPTYKTTLALAGRTRFPATVRLPRVSTRIGGFGGRHGLADWINKEGIDVVIDATHPFAAEITKNACRVSRQLDTAYLRLQRPAWSKGPKDRWFPVSNLMELSEMIPESAIVFLATGRQSLGELGGILAGRRLLCRVLDRFPSEFPYPDGDFVVGRPPYLLDDEVELFRRERVDWLVVKNSGGDLTRAKLDAARVLGIPVAMISRPLLPKCRTVETVEDCIAWLETFEICPPKSRG